MFTPCKVYAYVLQSQSLRFASNDLALSALKQHYSQKAFKTIKKQTTDTFVPVVC
jgi:hypothetical protein